jgi:hypothetical protein
MGEILRLFRVNKNNTHFQDNKLNNPNPVDLGLIYRIWENTGTSETTTQTTP